ncbi:MAG: hypothetical protein GWO08_23315, partial [Gammaproteobacteria bacterium]|nr:hypothetical protein [Gammaproteobacteria bacterium]
MSNTPGGGEYVDPAVVYTDASGTATATFYSGSASSNSDGVLVTASLDETLTAPAVKTSSVPIVINGTAGSITLSPSTKLINTYSNTMYSLPITLLVTDSNGSAVPNQVVTLNLWPEQYALGYWSCDPAELVVTARLFNEDSERDLDLSNSPSDDISGDGYLTPPNSSAGSVPPTV